MDGELAGARRAEATRPISEICRKTGLAEATFYRWKKACAALGATKIRRFKQLKEVDAR